jgi:hypothetical protein
LQSQQGRQAAGVEEDWGAARAWGVLLWMLVLLAEGGGCIASAWMVVCVRVGVCECMCERCRDAWRWLW